MKDKMLLMFAFVLFVIISANLAYADVGIGVSPSKIVLQVEGGKTQEISLLVFNSGDNSMEISVTSEGEIEKFTQIEPNSIVVEPEPKPHVLPIKNGKSFVVRFTPPATSDTKKYTGTISATGSPGAGSQFGGSVGVATQVELIVTPTTSIFAFLTATHIIAICAIVALIIIVLLLRRAGLIIQFKRKK